MCLSVINALLNGNTYDQREDEWDHTPLFRAYKRTGRPPATNPVTMIKILMYASMESNYTSRAIASSCSRDINYIWLLNGEKAPNHSEIARFRSKRLTECGEAFFYQLVKKLSVLGEIKYEHLFVDGTKIESNANKYSFVWKKSTTKYETRLLAKLEKLKPELCSRYGIMADTPEVLLNTKVIWHGGKPWGMTRSGMSIPVRPEKSSRWFMQAKGKASPVLRAK
ncbi:MAG TPA: transposase [Anaerovoracaceae bacterium]|nr:transposase [Anaerovoracaceae bacterium]